MVNARNQIGLIPFAGSRFGTMAQVIDADPYRDTAIRIACQLSSEAVEGKATMWVRIDDGQGKRLRFENLLERPGVAIDGTRDWTGFAITLDVPRAAESIYFGFLLSGRGLVRARNFTVDAVDAREAQPRSGTHRFERPTNLDFRG